MEWARRAWAGSLVLHRRHMRLFGTNGCGRGRFLRFCERAKSPAIVSISNAAMRGRETTYRRLDTPQHTIPITNLPLPIVNLLQPRINGLDWPPRCSRRRCSSSCFPRRRRWCSPFRSSGSSTRRRRRSSLPFQRLYILALIRRALQPGNQIQSLHENQVQHLLIIPLLLQRLIQHLRRLDILWNRHIFLLPREEDTPQIHGGILIRRRDKPRRGIQRNRARHRVREIQMRGLRQVIGPVRGRCRDIGGSRRRGKSLPGNCLPQREQRVRKGGISRHDESRCCITLLNGDHGSDLVKAARRFVCPLVALLARRTTLARKVTELRCWRR